VCRQDKVEKNRLLCYVTHILMILHGNFLGVRQMKKNNKEVSWLVGGVLAVFMLVGSANVLADDPMEDWNRDVLSFNDGLDDYFLKPVSQGYQWIMPEFADTGISNFFSNLSDIGVFVNDIFQLKLEQGGADFGRFLVNSTVGVGGFIDVATMIDLPKHKEDFGQTLAFWGVPSGPYMVVPLFGSSTPRGVVGAIGDIALHPLSYIGVPGASFGAGALNAVDVSADNLNTRKIAEEAALDRYSFLKDAYLQKRQYLVTDGDIPDDFEVLIDME